MRFLSSSSFLSLFHAPPQKREGGVSSLETGEGTTQTNHQTPPPVMRLLSFLGRYIGTFLYPPQCPLCEVATAQEGGLCITCWNKIAFIEKPYCNRLGLPFAVDYGMDMLSPTALAHPPRFERARAVARHEGAARALVSRLKYNERLDLAPFMADLMIKAGRDLFAEADLILPVPMHPRRLWWRRYNQAALLAQQIGQKTKIPTELEFLHRTKHTHAQVGLKRQARQHNLAGAFEVSLELFVKYTPKRVILVDDVHTTGSTLNACTHALHRAGVKHVDALTFTIVVAGEDIIF